MPNYSMTLYANWLPTKEIAETTGNNIVVDCKSTSLEYCEGSSTSTEIAYSAVRLRVTLNPGDYRGTVYSFVQWDIPPSNRDSDLLSIGWDKNDLSPNMEKQSTTSEAIYATQINYYEVVRKEWRNCGHYRCWKATSTVIDNFVAPEIEYKYSVLGSENFNIDPYGVVFKVPLQEDYFVRKDNVTSEGWDEYYHNVTKIRINFKTHFKIDDLDNGEYPALRTAFGQLMFATEYSHLYTDISADWSASAGIDLTGPSAGLNLTIMPIEDYDGPRRTEVWITLK